VRVPGRRLGPAGAGRADGGQQFGEFITRITGRPVPDVVRSDLLRPLGLDNEIVLGQDPYHGSDPQRGWRGGVNTFGSIRAIAAFVDPVQRVAGGVFGSGQLDAVQTRYFLRSACTAIHRQATQVGRSVR